MLDSLTQSEMFYIFSLSFALMACPHACSMLACLSCSKI